MIIGYVQAGFIVQLEIVHATLIGSSGARLYLSNYSSDSAAWDLTSGSSSVKVSKCSID